DAHTLLHMRGMSKAAQSYDWRGESTAVAADELEPSSAKRATAEERMQQVVSQLHQAVLGLQDQRIGGWFLENNRWSGWVAGIVSFFALLGGIAASLSIVGWIAGALIGAIIAGCLLWFLLPRGRRQTLRQYGRIQALIEDAHKYEREALADAK